LASCEKPDRTVSVQNILISHMPARIVIIKLQDIATAPGNGTDYPFAAPVDHGSIWSENERLS